MSQLFSPIQFRDLKVKNRIFVSPMCQYSAKDGKAQQWHLIHLGSRAVGGAGLVMAEATAVSPDGRISLADLGLWNEEQAMALRPITKFLRSQGTISAIQLAHAGRKAGTHIPWEGGKPLSSEEGAWIPIGPSALSYKDNYQDPAEMSEYDMQKTQQDFENAIRLALMAGFQAIEIHMAHGYLLHEFLSPISNQRTDGYGGSLENRMKFPLRVAKNLRLMWPGELPVFVRISATDWIEGGWSIEDSVIFSRELKKVGIDLIDVSSGGLAPQQQIKVGPLYQVPMAEKIRKEVKIMTGAVGMIRKAQEAEQILVDGKADVIFMAREFLRNPYWPLHAAQELGVNLSWPPQYERAKD